MEALVGRRWNVLVVAGIACFIIGVAIVFLLARDDDNGSNARPSSDTVPVLVAKEDIKPGTTGADAASKVEVQRVSIAERSADALSSPSELSTQLVVAAFGKGEQIRQGGLKRQTGQATSVALAKGKEAVAVAIPYVPSGAGYVAPGDLVNVYQVYSDTVSALNETGQQVAAAGLPYATPRVELLLTNVRVLEVQAAGATPLVTPTASNNPAGTSATTSQPTTGTATVILEVDTIDAEKVIFGSTIPKLSLYLSKVGENPPAGPTPGRDFGNQLEEEPNAAFSRANQ
jgi:Flp pilus assembly protein CpaB